ncbi:hypothetical protein YC2023_108825 [Brassica napus]
MIKDPHAWSNFATELEVIKTFQLCFLNFKISYNPRPHNKIYDSLIRTTRFFYRELCFIDCSIPVWLPRVPQV